MGALMYQNPLLYIFLGIMHKRHRFQITIFESKSLRFASTQPSLDFLSPDLASCKKYIFCNSQIVAASFSRGATPAEPTTFHCFPQRNKPI
jgi:hypothetical protein